MKKINLLQVFLLVFSISFLTTGCSNEETDTENPRKDLSFEESLKIDREGILSIEDNTYLVFKDKKSRKFSNEKFNYDIISNIKSELKHQNKNEDGTIVLYNNLDNTETLTFFNIQVIDDYTMVFSVLASNGDELHNLTYESETILTEEDINSKQYCWACLEIVVGIFVDVVIDGITSGGMDMTQICLGQITACYQSGGTPTNMQASSSWLGGDSCSLDCIPN
ncbi:hypothetical protein [Lacinutrix jangbogonensis]|uniref:hypothetical protein n=1 Tax=Lacinutrix jangbogonensis TaxID=1469557 RepID=UPI00053E0594|nr:hypothetical protein [Lacinutrix jangbogonensis]